MSNARVENVLRIHQASLDKQALDIMSALQFINFLTDLVPNGLDTRIVPILMGLIKDRFKVWMALYRKNRSKKKMNQLLKEIYGNKLPIILRRLDTPEQVKRFVRDLEKQLKEKIETEAEILKKSSALSFRSEHNDEQTTIYIDALGEEAGYIDVYEQVAYYSDFDDDFSEEQFDEMFPDGEYALISTLYVHPSHRGKGISKALIKAAIDYVRQQGLSTVYLNASPTGDKGLDVGSLVSLYKSFGFEEIKHQGSNVQMLLTF